MLLTGLVLAHLGIVQVEGTDASNHECFHIGVIAFLGDGIRFIGYVQLCPLVIELFHQDEQVLVEVHGFLAQAALGDFLVAFGHLHLPASLSPIQDRNLESDFNHLVVFQWVVSPLECTVGTGKAHLGEEVDLSQIAFSLGYIVFRFQLSATDVVCEGIVLQGLVQNILIVETDVRKAFGQDGFQLLVFA